MWMQDGCKVYMESYIASNGSCFMVTWTLVKNGLLEAGLTINSETVALQTLTTVGLFSYIKCEDPHDYTFIEIAFSWEPYHIWLHTTLEGLWPHYMILEVCWDGLWTPSFGLSQFHGHSSWLVCVKWPWVFCQLLINQSIDRYKHQLPMEQAKMNMTLRSNPLLLSFQIENARIVRE